MLSLSHTHSLSFALFKGHFHHKYIDRTRMGRGGRGGESEGGVGEAEDMPPQKDTSEQLKGPFIFLFLTLSLFSLLD